MFSFENWTLLVLGDFRGLTLNFLQVPKVVPRQKLVMFTLTWAWSNLPMNANVAEHFFSFHVDGAWIWAAHKKIVLVNNSSFYGFPWDPPLYGS